MHKTIIDVSTWQENLDYKQLKASGVDGIIIRAGFSTTLDNEFYNHINGALEAEFEYIGAYWFGYAGSTTETIEEAKKADEILAPYKDKLNLGVYYDWEYYSENKIRARGIVPTKALVTDMNKAFCHEMTARGYIAGYYLNPDYANRLVDETKLTAYRRWLAMWTSSCDEECFLWQYTDEGHIEGITQVKTGIDENGNPYTYYEPTFDLNELRGELPKPQPTSDVPVNTPTKPRGQYAITYRSYIEDYGWLDWVGDGEMSGTQGRKLAIQAIQIEGGLGRDILSTYQVYCETNGETAWAKCGEVSGTQDLNRDVQAIRINANVPIRYRTYCQKKGWTPWVTNGQWSGARDEGLRVEAIQIEVLD
jgi:hypothetical protein